MIRFGAPIFLVLFPFVVLAIGLLLHVRWTRLASRVLILLLFFLALARPELSLIRQDRTTMILLDRSASLRVAQSDMSTFSRIQELVDANPGQEFGMIEFADTADMVYVPGEYRPTLFPTTPVAPATHIQAAVELALAAMSGGQIVLLSDGRFSDDVGVAIAKAQAAQVPIHVLPVGTEVAEDLSVSAFTAPAETAVARPFVLRVDVEAPQASQARLIVYRDDDLIIADEVELSRGRNTFAFTETLETEGVAFYQVFIRSDADPIDDNDTLSTTVQSSELASVLVVDGAETGVVPRLLAALGIPYEVVPRIPSIETLSQYRQLLLADVALATITASEADRIANFVRNMGGGLFVIRGERAVTGFAGTKLDDLLPVSSTVPEVQQEASLALVYVLDRSTSMRGLVRTPAGDDDDTTMHAKIRVLRDATAASVALLPASTLVGIIGFDTEYDWLRPISRIGDTSGIMGILRRLRAGGGTDVFYPIQAAVEALEEVDARFKHILFISDGWTVNEPRDFDGLYERMRLNEDIALSIIAPDENPNFALLSAIVEAGEGELYHVSEFTDLPATMLNITQRLSRSRFVQETTEVTGLLADRLAPLNIPPIDGYILAYPRADATVYAWADDDPLFTTWNLGIGVVSTLNTDLAGDWTADWVTWPSMSQLFSEMFVLSEPSLFAAEGVYVSVTLSEQDVEILVDARNERGEFADWLHLTAVLLPLEESANLRQVAPGLYRTTFPRPESGGYALRITDESRGSTIQLPMTIPYSTEYSATGADSDELASIASMTGGDVLSSDDLILTEERRFAHRAFTPIHKQLLWAALAVLLLELIILRWPRRRVQPIASSTR